MLRNKWILLVLIALLATAVAFAGEHSKCTMSTQDCLNAMAARMKSGGYVGIMFEVDESSGGYSIEKVIPGTPAEAAGLKAGDALVALNGVRISKDNHEALDKARGDWKPGQKVTYTIKRDGAERQVALTLAAMPADMMAKYIGEHMLEHAAIDVAHNSK